MKARALLLVSMLCLTAAARAQDSLRPAYGVSGGWTMNAHTADFRALPGFPNCCPRFQSGDGNGINGGIVYDLPLSSRFALSFRANYVSHDATLLEREAIRIIVGGVGADGAFEHSIDVSIASLGLEPLVAIRPMDHLAIMVGLRGGATVSKRFAQKEVIVDPPGVGTFLDSLGRDSQSRIRNDTSAELSNVSSILIHGVAAVTYELPLNARGTWQLSPEVAWMQGLNDVVDGLTWKMNGLRVSLGMKYSPPFVHPTFYDTTYTRDTTVRLASLNSPRLTLTNRTSNDIRQELEDATLIRTSVHESYLLENPEPVTVTCSVTAAGVSPDGQEEPIAALRVEEFEAINTLPMLNFVFFDPGSSTLPGRYVTLDRGGADSFRPEHLFGRGTIPTYHSMLNIIGERMRQYPDAVLTLTGCNADVDDEKGETQLSMNRAITVRDYFSTVWGIDTSRLRIAARNLPAHPSNRATVDGQQENRRVEITSDTPEILDVFIAHDTTRTTNPPIVRLHLAASASRGVGAWRLLVKQHGSILREYSGSGAPPETLDWDLTRDGENLPRFSEPLQIDMQVTDREDRRAENGAQLPTRVVTLQEKRDNVSGDVRIDRYNLILFDYNSSALGAGNQRIVGLVQSRLKPSSQITVEGFTDRSGDANANRRLAEARAKSSANAIGRKDAVYRGIGEDRLLFDNDLPEGRFLCRTVQITVRTPVGR